MPVLPKYDGVGDPVAHCQNVRDLVKFVSKHDEVLCQAFPTTLEGRGRTWYDKLSDEREFKSGRGDVRGPVPLPNESNKRKVHDRLDSYETNRKQKVHLPTPFRTPLPLTELLGKIFNTMEKEKIRQRPNPIKGDPRTRDRNQYCRFHKDFGHDTNDCKNLKREVESLVSQGYFKEYIQGSANEDKTCTDCSKNNRYNNVRNQTWRRSFASKDCWKILWI
ncbi:hypothetical protein LIER_33674 [Lithospermum erythrorhizon]|uniref:Reverse transcriptase domain-containing protein n=1 Tax=Lithospermum erythrorhizon TaxID=34254 RepID=A0AAV3S2Z1_LITER